jgi:hypothetical protein
MMFRVIAAVAIVGAAGYWLARFGRWVHAQWFIKRVWRFLSGQAHHGHPVTDAGWFRRGQRALTTTGHATRWWHLPRWQRAAHRTGGTFGVAALVLAFLVNAMVTALVLLTVTFGGLSLLGWVTWRRIQTKEARRSFLFPLHLAAHQVAGIPRATRAESWIKPELNAAGAILGVTLELPAGWPSDTKDEARLVGIVGAKAAIESPKVEWQRAGPVPLLTLRHSPPPPGHVTMATLLPELPKLREHQLLLGVGIGDELVIASLDTDSPHVAITAGTGGTKSNLAGWLLLQVLLRGGIGLVLDAKRRLSYPWILKDRDRNLVQLPNVAYAWTTAQLHEGMCWLSDELDRRGDVAFAGMDDEGTVHANVGPRQLTIAEELNLAVPRLKMHWARERDPGDPPKSPALTGLGEDAFAGREVNKHLALVGQALTAEVTGSKDSSVRQQCGIKLLTRYEQALWRMMCGDVPMPSSPTQRGRYQAVFAGETHLTQTPQIDRRHARELVLAGNIGKLPSTIPRSLVTGIPGVFDSGPWAADVTGSGPLAVTAAGPVLVTLKEAVERGRVRPATTVAALKMCRFRDRDGFPEKRGSDGQAALYDADELSAYDMARG